MENAAKLIAIPILSMFLAACGDGESPKQANSAAGPKVDKVLRVGDGFTFNDQPALSLALGGTEANYFDVTLYRSNARAGYVGSATRASNSELDVSANWGGKYYVQSSKHPTEVMLKINSVTPTEAVIEFSAKLVHPSSGELLELDNSVVKVEGEALKRLTAN